MALNTDWKEFLALLVSRNVEFLVVGAWARAHYGEPRMTGDIDFWVRRSEDNATKLVEVIRKFGFESLGLTESDFLEPDTIVQLGYPPRRIDILTNLTALEFEDAWDRKVPGELEGIPVSFLSREDFVTNKRAVGRAKDLADIEALGDDPFSASE